MAIFSISCRQSLATSAAFSLLLLILGYSPLQAQAQFSACGDLENAFGPFDYLKESAAPENKHNLNSPLYLVESTHFRPHMEALVPGINLLGQEFDYTLRAFPNHHRALNAIARLSEREKNGQPKGSRYTVDCWFDRAIRFRKDDIVVRMLLASYLGNTQRNAEAMKQLEAASKLAGDNGFSRYNVGMVYFDLKEYGLALEQAHAAMRLGMPRTGLRERLTAIGQWKEPQESTEAAVPESPTKSTSQ